MTLCKTCKDDIAVFRNMCRSCTEGYIENLEDDNVDLRSRLKEHEWTRVEDGLPEKMQRVAVVFNNSSGLIRKAMAEYVPKKEVLAEDYISDEYDDFCDHDKENDIDYAPEGFYEYNYGSDICMHMSTDITHWKPITLPETKK